MAFRHFAAVFVKWPWFFELFGPTGCWLLAAGMLNCSADAFFVPFSPIWREQTKTNCEFKAKP